MVIFKRILAILAILIALVMLLWGAVVGIIATPEIITPRIVDVLQQHTKSEVSIKSVDLSLFTRFPNITLRIDSLRIAQTKDSISDLIFARQCRISIDPIALLSKKVKINRFSLQHASLYLYVDSLNGPLKTFILPEEDPEEVDTLTSSMDMSEYSLSIKRLKIDSTQIVIDDRTKEFYTRVENLGVDMSLNASNRTGDLDVKTGFSNLIVWHKGDVLVKRTSLDLRSKMEYDRDSMLITFDKARVKLNGIDFKTRGMLRRDTLNNGVEVDIRGSLNTPSLTEFLALVPSSVIDSKDEITTQGSVAFDVEVKGLYSDESLPTAEIALKVSDAKAKYASRKLALENVNCDAFIFVDLNTPKKSYADIKSMQVNTSDIIKLDLSGKVSNIIENPAVDMSVKSNINLTRFTEVFPLNGGIVCKGMTIGDIKTQFSLLDIESSNYSNMYIEGETTFTNLEISIDPSKFEQDTSSLMYLYMQAENGKMIFGDNTAAKEGSRTLRAVMNFQDLGYKSKDGESLTIKDIELKAGANFDRTTSEVNGFGVRGIAQNMVVGIDSLFSSTLETSDVTLVIKPQKEGRNASINSAIISHQITVNEPNYNSEMELSTVNMNVVLEKNEDAEAKNRWSMDGEVAFSDLDLYTDLFPLKISVPETNVSVGSQTINLNNAKLKVGSSEFVATGYIQNLIRKLFVEPRLSIGGELAIKATYVDFTELMEASNKSVLLLEELESETTDSLTVSVAQLPQEADSLSIGGGVADSLAQAQMAFLVPRGLSFVFNLNIDKAQFEKATIEKINGRATIDKGKLTLDKLRLNAIGATATGSIIYSNIDRQNTNIMANMSLVGVDINRIDELMPSLITMFPMFEELEGSVDLDIKINTNLDINSEPDISTLCSAMRLKGKDLVLMDSETFADLSKTLMFKNKDRNLIDSLEMYALVDKARIDVLPFQMSIDRYTAIIGGTQDIDPETFDVDYSYNISIIKSPLPFKAGLDVTGNLDDYKYKVTSAKLKKTDFDEQRGYYEEYRNSIEESSAELQKEIEAKRQAARAEREARRLAQEQEAIAEEQLESEESDQNDLDGSEDEDDGTEESSEDVETLENVETSEDEDIAEENTSEEEWGG
ncbi:MAG: AsmA family protein [Rikenellaceae bacterium]